MRIATMLGLAVVLLVGGCAGVGDELAGGQVTVRFATVSTATGGATSDAAVDAAAVDAASVSAADRLWLAFSRVDLVPAGEDGGGIVSLELAGGGDLLLIDALALDQDDVAAFAETNDVPAGEYAQVRLIVESVTLGFCAEVTDEECTAYDELDVFVPSGAQTGLKINVEPGPLVVGADDAYLLTVVFDPGEAIVETPPGSGNYLLKPTAIRVLNESSGDE